MKEKDPKVIYKLKTVLNYLFLLSIAGSFSFLITALVLKGKQQEYLVWYILAGIFLLISCVCLVTVRTIKQTKEYKEIVQSIRKEKYVKAKNKIREYIFDIDTTEAGGIESLLQDFELEQLGNGKIFFMRPPKNIYDKKKEAYEIFYFPNVSNTHDLTLELAAVKNYAETVTGFLKSKNYGSEFVDCVIVFQYDNLNESEKDFYRGFTGFWDCEMKNNKFLSNKFFTYCGIDKSKRQAFFYFPLWWSDEGTEVNLDYLIIDALKLKAVDTTGQYTKK